jgi:hypothetical protein
MNLLRKSIYWAVLVILIEASVRKYIFASPLVILVKYLFLLPLFFCAFKRPSLWYSAALLAITLPLLATIPSTDFIPYAVYDLISIFFLPVLFFCLSLSRSLFSSRSAQKLLYLVALIGLLNSTLVIIQSFVGPQHWLSQTVDQSFSVHAFGEALKAPGLAGTSSPYMSIAGLIALDVLRRLPNPKPLQKLILTSLIIIAISVVFNLTSRTYVFGIICYVMPRFLIPSLVNKRFDKSTLVFLVLPLTYYLLQTAAPEWGLTIFSANRAVDDFSTAADRLFAIPLLSLFSIDPFTIPLMDGVGLGYAVNNNPFADPFFAPLFCKMNSIGTEHEYERLICSFGGIGFLHILSRVVLAAIAVRNAINYLKPRYPASIASGWIFFSLALANGLLLRANDTATGTLLLLITLSASQSLMQLRGVGRSSRGYHLLSTNFCSQ